MVEATVESGLGITMVFLREVFEILEKNRVFDSVWEGIRPSRSEIYQPDEALVDESDLETDCDIEDPGLDSSSGLCCDGSLQTAIYPSLVIPCLTVP